MISLLKFFGLFETFAKQKKKVFETCFKVAVYFGQPEKFDVKEEILLLVREIVRAGWNEKESKEIMIIIEANRLINNCDTVSLL